MNTQSLNKTIIIFFFGDDIMMMTMDDIVTYEGGRTTVMSCMSSDSFTPHASLSNEPDGDGCFPTSLEIIEASLLVEGCQATVRPWGGCSRTRHIPQDIEPSHGLSMEISAAWRTLSNVDPQLPLTRVFSPSPSTTLKLTLAAVRRHNPEQALKANIPNPLFPPADKESIL